MDDLVASVKMLVVACNSASAASLADARERYDVPVVEVVLPAVRGRPPPPATATSASSAPRPRSPAAPTRTPSPPPRITVDQRRLPELRRLRRARGDQRPAAPGAGPVLPRPADRRRRHRRPRLPHYPMLTGVISLVMGDDVTLVSSADETAKDVYRVLTRRPAATRTDRRPSTASWPPATRSRSPGWDGASSAPRSERCCAPNRWGPREAHRRRLRQRAGPKSPASATWSSTTDSGCCWTSATALRAAAGPARPGDHRRGLPLPPARRPLPRHRAVRRLAPLLRSVDVRPGAAVRAGRGRAAAGAGLRRWTASAHRRLRLRAGRPGSFALGPFEVTLARTAHPGVLRHPASTAARWSTRATPARASAVVELARGADVLLAEAAHPPGLELPPELHRRRGEAALRRGRGGAAAAHARAGLGGRDRPAVLGRARVPETELVRAGATYQI